MSSDSLKLNPYEFVVLCSQIYRELNDFSIKRELSYSSVISKVETENWTRELFVAKLKSSFRDESKNEFFLTDNDSTEISSVDLSILG